MTSERKTPKAATKTASKKPHLRLIQGGKSDTKEQAAKPAKAQKIAQEKMAQEKPTKRVHPFSQFFGKAKNMTGSKPNSREQTLSHQIPRKRAV